MKIKFVSGYGRVILAIISFYFMPTNYVVACWCYIISGLLDAVDGHAARYFNQSKLAVKYEFILTMRLLHLHILDNLNFALLLDYLYYLYFIIQVLSLEQFWTS